MMVPGSFERGALGQGGGHDGAAQETNVVFAAFSDGMDGFAHGPQLAVE
jgi:hypothetical protein